MTEYCCPNCGLGHEWGVDIDGKNYCWNATPESDGGVVTMEFFCELCGLSRSYWYDSYKDIDDYQYETVRIEKPPKWKIENMRRVEWISYEHQ